MLLLGRNRFDTLRQLLFLGTDIANLDFQAHNQVVDRTDDGLLHRTQRIVQIHHDRVLVTTVADELVALQQGLVVFGNLLFDAGIRYTCVGRNQVGGLLRIVQIFLDIAGKAQLVFEAKTFLLIHTCVLQIHTRFRGNIGQLVGPLKLFDAGIHATQFLLDNHQTVGDEVRGIDRNAVLVVDSILVIDRNQRIQDIFRTGDRDILQSQVDDGCRLGSQGRLQIGLVFLDHLRHVRLPHLYRFVII